MVDTRTEKVMPVPAACRRLGEMLGSEPHPATVMRWIMRGVGGVKLEAIRIGRSWLTSEEAILRFAAARAASSTGEPPASPTQAAERAGRELAAAWGS